MQPVKTEWWGAGVVICVERGADLHMGEVRKSAERLAVANASK